MAQYDSFMNRFSRRMAFAVGGIIAGVGVCGLLETKNQARGKPEDAKYNYEVGNA